jgi:hypothetical protein
LYTIMTYNLRISLIIWINSNISILHNFFMTLIAECISTGLLGVECGKPFTST